MKIATVLGARPQFIKAAPVSAALRETGLSEVVIHTGQHYDTNMSDIFFKELGIDPPDHYLGVGSGLHGQQTGRMMEKLEPILMHEQPGCVLVYGDTNSTIAGALVAAKLQVAVAHVEAGLRSFNRRMPEEINRVVTDHLSSLLFVPTKVAARNLRNEGIQDDAIIEVGDVMLDAALMFAVRAEQRSNVMKRFSKRRYALATIHRAENTDDPARLATILNALSKVCRDLPVVFPVHPRTRRLLDKEREAEFVGAGGTFMQPVGYFDMIMLERNAAVIVTDSGGVQKEAFFYRVPCVTLRDETEWTELIELGWNVLVGAASSELIYETVLGAIGRTGIEASPYGVGNASQLIAKRLKLHSV